MMVYGQTLDLPGQIVLQKHEIKREDSFSFASNLSKHLKEQNIVSTQWHGNNKSYVPKRLNDAKYVLVRKDENHIPSLSPKYNGPYKVLERKEKAFVLDLENKVDTVSVDRLVPFQLRQDLLERGCISHST